MGGVLNRACRFKFRAECSCQNETRRRWATRSGCAQPGSSNPPLPFRNSDLANAPRPSECPAGLLPRHSFSAMVDAIWRRERRIGGKSRMNETSPGLIDAETPVNPYSLLEAVNRSSDSANTAWLIYIALMSYLLITVAGISHKDLLLNSDITLPILQVRIELTRFFLLAPILLLILHLGVMVQLVQLARKTHEFAASIRMLETSDQRTHPLRLELDNFFFVQAIAGPERSRV